jgi:hypothetical protein
MTNNNNNEIWVEIKLAVFKKAHFKNINFLIQLLNWSPSSTKKYNFFVRVTYSHLKDITNFKALLPVDQKMLIGKINDAFTNSKSENPKYKITNKKNRQRNEFTILEFIRFFQSPVLLILENSLNDGYFVRTIFDYFSPKNADNKSKLTEFLDNDWIQFVNAGGWKNIANYIEGRKNSLKDFATQQGREATDFIKCFVLIDNDKLYASYSDADVRRKEQLKLDLEAQGIQVHILNKRAMENYIPDEMIVGLPTLNNRYAQFQNWINVYHYLSGEQKDYLSYEKGFGRKVEEVTVNSRTTSVKVNKPRNEQEQGIRNLYPSPSINDNDYEIIDTGLNGFPAFKKEFPKFFENRAYVNKITLLNREGGTETNNEFLEIIEKIMSLL